MVWRWLIPCGLFWAAGLAAALPYPPPAGLERATQLLWADQYEEASHLLEGVTDTLPPDSRPARDFLLGYARLQQGEATAAYPLLRQSIETFPALGDTLRLLAAQAALKSGQPGEAAALLQAVLVEPNPRLVPAALRHLAAAQEGTGDLEQAIHTLGQYVAAGGEDFLAQAVYDQARLHATLGRYATAQGLYQRVWEEFPGDELAAEAARAQLRLAAHADVPRADGAALYARATRAAAGYHHDEVIHTVRLLQRRAPDFARMDRVALKLGKAQFYRRDFAQAAATFHQAVRQHVDSPLVPELLDREAEARLRLGQRTRATHLVETLVQRFPDDPETGKALYMLGKHHHLRGEVQKARHRLTELDRLQPHGARTDDALLRLGWIAYADQDWETAHRWFTTLVQRFGHTTHNRVEALYWAGRCAENLGDFTGAQRNYHATLAPNRWDYFAQEAAHRLALLGNPQAEDSFRLIAQSETHLEPQPSPYLDRARLLASLGLRDLAQREIAYAVYADRIPAESRLAYLCLLSELGGNDLSLAKLRRQYGKALIRGDQELPVAVWRALYPLPERPLLEREAARSGVDPYLLASLINQESGHNPRAYSPAGAHGLMQLIWPTARGLARRLEMPLTEREQLFDPAINLRLGTQYLADLLELFDGNTAAALAAYNAGEHRVSQWLAADPGQGTPEFVATIPFRETRKYVERVLSHYGAYRAIYAPPPAADATADVATAPPASTPPG
ncbi:MAG: transglycosylase SLT domain-containing protein [Nitrospirota bacterium]|jgi:soluble lytic murein transglycosylase